jgi:hypothetical protein
MRFVYGVSYGGGMPSTLFAGHVVALAAEHAHANGGVGMPPGERRYPS